MIMLAVTANHSHAIRYRSVDRSPPRYGCCRGLVTEILAGAISHLVTILCYCGREKLRVIESFGQSYRHVSPPDSDATGNGMVTETHLKAPRQSITVCRRDSLKENLNLLLQRSTSDEALQRSMRVWGKALGIFILDRSKLGQHSWEEMGVKLFACKMTQPP
jgi:hypothetical protein